MSVSALKPLAFSHFTATSALGKGLAPHLEALTEQRSGLASCTFETVDLPTFVGEVYGLQDVRMRHDLSDYDCRNNRLAQVGLEQDTLLPAVKKAIARYGAERIGVFIGTSTSGILETELAYRQRDPLTGTLPSDYQYAKTQNTFSVASFTRAYLGLKGPAAAISSACSSSAKVFGTARRMIAAGLIDAAVVGGVDTLCLTTLYGFNSLDLLSTRACRPFDMERDGISIGEAAAFGLLQRADEAVDSDAVLLLGVGESSDAYHMSSPHPEGLGARMAMSAALEMAALQPGQIDYINLHGTATPSNDAAEAKAVSAIWGETTPPCSSTKGATGHTLGAAGGIEAIFSALSLQHDLLPGGINTERLDPALEVAYLMETRNASVTRVMSNSFGFGGTNCSLIFGKISSL